MLSGVLHSDRAIQGNAESMPTFVRLRKLLVTNEALAEKLDILEKRYDKQFKLVFEAIREIMTPTPPADTKNRIREVTYGPLSCKSPSVSLSSHIFSTGSKLLPRDIRNSLAPADVRTRSPRLLEQASCPSLIFRDWGLCHDVPAWLL